MNNYEYKEKIKEYLEKIEKSDFKSEIFLKELILNSNEAVLKKEKMIDNNFDYEGIVEIYFEPSDKSITIVDNGIGMSKDELADYVHKYSVKKILNNKIGLFFLFAIGEKVNIISKKLGENTAHKFISDLNSFSIAPCINDEDSGTVIYIKLKDEYAVKFTNKENLMSYLIKLRENVKCKFFMSYYDEKFQEQIEEIK